MMTPKTILFATDFSAGCDRARDRAVQLARRWEASLVLCHVASDRDSGAMAEAMTPDAAILARLREEVREEGIAVETRLASGDVAEAIVETSAEFAAGLIVIGISRRDEIGDFIVGTTMERMIPRARVPVLMVRNRAHEHYRRIMAATDFSDCSGLALRTAAAMFPEAEITLLHAYRVALETLRGREGPAAAQQAGIAFGLDAFLKQVGLPADVTGKLEINVDYGEVCDVARDHVRASNTDLAVIGTHGRSAFVAAVLGSSARALLTCLDCDVLLVPPACDD